MLGPEVGLFTVNHEPNNIRVIMTKPIRIKKNARIGARVNILPGVTIGENAIIGTASNEPIYLVLRCADEQSRSCRTSSKYITNLKDFFTSYRGFSKRYG